jgi:hypothetical protein
MKTATIIGVIDDEDVTIGNAIPMQLEYLADTISADVKVQLHGTTANN